MINKPIFDKSGRRILNRQGNTPSWKQFDKPVTSSSYRVGKSVFHPQVLKNMGDWRSIELYIKSCPDIRSTVCFRCGASAGNLYDKNNVAYKISRSLTLEQVKILIEEIRKINAG